MLKVSLARETDFLVARRRAKQIAKLLGFEVQDQTRIATAVSEIARNAFEYGRGGMVEFILDRDQPQERENDGGRRSGISLRIEVQDSGSGIPHLEEIWAGSYISKTGMGIGLTGARRLMDSLEVESGESGTRVKLVKHLSRTHSTPPDVQEIAISLAQGPSGYQDVETNALHDQNQELLMLLAELRTREQELRLLNAELEETNRGVVVLYAELEDKAQAVQQASEMKTRFLSGVTHELRTPLNSVVSLSRLMLSHTDGPLNAEQEKQVHFILRSAQNLAEMVNDLLDLAKIEAGKAITNLTKFTVAELYAGLRGMFRPLSTNANVTLLFEIPEAPLMLFSDEGKLAQILRNFISNALKFTERGTVTVTATPLRGNEIRFSVSDTGVGIAAENHNLVMQEWGQVQQDGQAMAGRAKGSGLGLPLSRNLAELLGGSIDFTSEFGKGSVFNVTLPALLTEDTGAGPALEDEAPYILMVDDDEVARYLLRRNLSAMTMARIEEATSGQAALKEIEKHLPSLVFLDLSMPGMDGLEVARALRGKPETEALPVVLFTAKVLNDEDQRALEELDLMIVSKGNNAAGGAENQRALMERALLQVGLSNVHTGPA